MLGVQGLGPPDHHSNIRICVGSTDRQAQAYVSALAAAESAKNAGKGVVSFTHVGQDDRLARVLD